MSIETGRPQTVEELEAAIESLDQEIIASEGDQEKIKKLEEVQRVLLMQKAKLLGEEIDDYKSTGIWQRN